MGSREGNSSGWCGVPGGAAVGGTAERQPRRQEQREHPPGSSVPTGAGDETVNEPNDIPPRGALRAAEQPAEKPRASRALRKLAAEAAEGPRSETSQLREILDDVEHALGAGASHAEVLRTLHDHGFTMTRKSFKSTLYRLRKERRQTRSGGVLKLVRTNA